MEHEVHRSNAKHGCICVEAVKHPVPEVLFYGFIRQLLLKMLLHIFCAFHDKAGATHSRVANHILRSRLHQFYHHADNMTGCAELTVSTTGSHLAEHIFIDVTHRVAVAHVKFTDTVNHFNQSARILNHKHGILHEPRVGRLLSLVQILDIDKHILTDDTEHFVRLKMPKITPAHICHRHIFVSNRIMPATIIKHRLAHMCSKSGSLVLLTNLGIIKHLHEQKISHLFKKSD